ncbi:MAG: nuclear transport factor 2 family protein [Desulfobacterales bacterium]|nr:nuclear transport factor 2 family protein [Desulfobacterales bacterium]
MDAKDYQKIRQLFDEYLRMYSSRDDRLTTYFSEDFSGFTGGGDSLVKNREEWVAITRQDFAEVKDPVRIELKDLSIQSLADTIAVTTGFFTIHLPIKDHILSKETARLVLIFRKESEDWKISHSSISIPYHLVREGEVYPLKELVERNQLLEQLIAERTIQLSEANDHLQKTNKELTNEIAERKQTGDALQESNQKIEAIMSISPDGIGIMSLDGKIQRISDKLVKMHGYSTAEIDEYLGKSVLEFIDPSSHKELIDNTRKVLAGVESDKKLTEYLAIKKDRSRFNIDVNSTVLLDSKGNPTSILYVERDITERKRTEADKEKLEAQNRQLQKAESLGRMAGAIAHQFNNRLAAVTGNLELAMMDLSEGANPHEKITAALEASNRAAEISGLMLTYLGQSNEKHSPMDLSEACRRTMPMLKAIISGDIVLETDLPSPGPVIMSNANQILQILTNLVTNAREAIGESRGAIGLCVKTVFAEDFPAGQRFPLDWQPQNNAYACLEVTDTGCRIEEKNIEKLFDPFFSSKFTGRGMGLAVVLGIVRAHNGVVLVENKPGRSSTFRIFFPLSGETCRRK